jgi:hypothetical protein
MSSLFIIGNLIRSFDYIFIYIGFSYHHVLKDISNTSSTDTAIFFFHLHFTNSISYIFANVDFSDQTD